MPSELLVRHDRGYWTWARALFVERSLAGTACSAIVPNLPDNNTAPEVFATQVQTFIGPWTPTLQQQLNRTASTVALLAELRATVLRDEWKKLTPSEQSLLRPLYDERQSFRTLAPQGRELTTLHLALLERVQATLPDETFEWPGNHVEVARLTLQLVNHHESDEARLLLETLLLGDPATQGFYHRFMALIGELDLLFHPLPSEKPVVQQTPFAVTRRERLITIAFVVAVVVALVWIGRLLLVR